MVVRFLTVSCSHGVHFVAIFCMVVRFILLLMPGDGSKMCIKHVGHMV